MKIYIARFMHETNTFSPVPTPITRFSKGLSFPTSGQESYEGAKNTKTCYGGMIDAVEESGFDLIPGLNAGSAPSGIVDQEVFEEIQSQIIDELKSADAAILALHGAMVTTATEDGEGLLLKRIRQKYPGLPIAISLDMHTNFFEDMIQNCDIISGFQTYPHIDMYDTSLKAGRLLIKLLKGQIKPVMEWGNKPMIPHVMRQGTDDSPNKELQEMCREFEKQGALSVSLFTGFPHADIKNAGLSAVAVTDNDPAWANEIKNNLLNYAWQERKKFVYQIEPLKETVQKAKTYAQKLNQKSRKPVMLLDHYDNTASGGTMDTTETLQEVINQELKDVAFYGICDQEAVQKMKDAGVGAEIELTLGGKFKINCFGNKQSKPVTLKGKVKFLMDEPFQLQSEMGKGENVYTGPSGVFDTGNIEIIIVSRHAEPFDLMHYKAMGIDPAKKTFLLHKSRIHYRAAYRPILEKVFECCGFGICTSDYSQLSFKNIRRPIYPLDEL